MIIFSIESTEILLLSEANPEGTLVGGNLEDFFGLANKGDRNFIDFKVKRVFKTFWNSDYPVEMTFLQFALSKDINIAKKDIDRKLFNIATADVAGDLKKHVTYTFDEKNHTVVFSCEPLISHRPIRVERGINSPVETYLSVNGAKLAGISSYLYSPMYSNAAAASLLS